MSSFLIDQFHVRERMRGMQFTYGTSRLEVIPGVHLVHKYMKDKDNGYHNAGKDQLY